MKRVFEVDFVELVKLDEFAAYTVNDDFLLEIGETAEVRTLIEYFKHRVDNS